MTTDNIARADEIVGLKKDRDWPKNFISEYVDDIRRTRYLKWLDENATNAATFSFFDDITRFADAIVAAHAAKHPQPSDGLPPGPWKVESGEVHDACLSTVCRKLTAEFKHYSINAAIQAFIARCGSPAVRSILAACDDAELGRWSKIIGQYQVAGDCDALIGGEFRSPFGGPPTFGEITLACMPRRK
jgi:hypothetical protein